MSSTATATTPRHPAVLAHESQESFDQLAARLRAEFHPEGEHRTFLVDRMIQARWTLVRFERLQAEAFEEILTAPDPSDDSPDGRILAALTKRSNILDKLDRRIREAERAYGQAHRQFQTALAAKAPKQPAAAKPEPAPLSAKKLDQMEAELRAYINRRSQYPPMPTAPAASKKAADLGNPALRL